MQNFFLLNKEQSGQQRSYVFIAQSDPLAPPIGSGDYKNLL